MSLVSYFSPFVPPEWIAAHGLQPNWLVLDRSPRYSHDAEQRGICSCAAAVIAEAARKASCVPLVLSTACDQLRHAAAYLDTIGGVPIFLFNVPSTWQTPQVRDLYRQELRRLGRFLVRIGGRQPTDRELIEMTERYDDRRKAVLAELPRFPAQRRANALVGLRSDLSTRIVMEDLCCRTDGIPLLLLGGPSLEQEDFLVQMVEKSGGQVVADGTETGQRTLPAPVDRRRLRTDPLDELTRIYFDTIPDVFRRPNTRLYEWLGQQLSTHEVRGIILRRYPFCDPWHGEVYRIRQTSKLPVLDIDAGVGEEGERSRIQGRIEAFLEMLR